MSLLNVNKVDPQTGTTLELGTSGDTVSIPSGVTIANSGTATGFGVSLANGVDNRVVTASSATALNGEANLTFDGSVLTAIGDNGTTSLSPNATYDNIVIDDNGSSGITYLGSTTANQQIRFDDSGGNRGVISYNHDGDTMGFGTAGADRAIITSTGILGLGAGNASADLGVGLHIKTADSSADVNGDADELVIEGNGETGMSILSSTSTSGWINFGDSGDNDIGKIQYNHDNNGMFFFTNTAQQMCILSDGDVGIGEANPAGKLEVKGDADTDIARFRTGTDGRQIKMMNTSDTQVGGIAINASDTQYVTTSDYRLKENETSITDGITRLKTLKPYRFNFKADADKTVDGFFAHEVSSIVPEAITGEKDAMHPEVLYTADDELPEGKEIGDVKEETKINAQGIDQSKLVPLLVASLQEAITKIETLETKVAALESA